MNSIHALSLSTLFLIFAASCSEQADVSNSVAQLPDAAKLVDAAKPVDVEVSQAREKLSELVVLDVRSAGEFAHGHIEGAINIDVNGPDFETAVAQLDPEKTYLVHCAVNPKNGRAEKALDTMSELGFSKLQNLVGGYAAWAGTI